MIRGDDRRKNVGFYRKISVIGRRRQIGASAMWMMVGLGILGGILLYWYTTPQEAPVWVRDRLPGMPEYTDALYRWRDSQGQWQVSDKPPRNRPYEVVQYRGDTNVMPSKER